MCRRASRLTRWPGPASPEGWRKLLSGSGFIVPKLAPKRARSVCWHAMTVTAYLQSSLVRPATARPIAPAEPPPPEVRAAVKETWGMPRVSVKEPVSNLST
jgi:hypothetical protein